MTEIPFCGSAHRDPKNPDGDHIPAPVWESKAASVRSRLAKEPHFDQTVFNKGSYVNLANKTQLIDALSESYFTPPCGRRSQKAHRHQIGSEDFALDTENSGREGASLPVTDQRYPRKRDEAGELAPSDNLLGVCHILSVSRLPLRLPGYPQNRNESRVSSSWQ